MCAWNQCQMNIDIQSSSEESRTSWRNEADWYLKPFLSNPIVKWPGLVRHFWFLRDDLPVIPCSTLHVLRPKCDAKVCCPTLSLVCAGRCSDCKLHLMIRNYFLQCISFNSLTLCPGGRDSFDLPCADIYQKLLDYYSYYIFRSTLV